MTSTAFFHSLTVCGYMLCMVEGVAADIARRGAQDPPRCCGSDDDDGAPLDTETRVLMDVVPKVQATGCRCAARCMLGARCQ